MIDMMWDKSKLQVGMTVWLKSVGNNARDGMKIKQRVVKKIGRKYFEVWDGERERSSVQFDLENGRQANVKTIADWALYLSEQDMKDEETRLKLDDELWRYFSKSYGRTNLTLEQLRAIKQIIWGDGEHNG